MSRALTAHAAQITTAAVQINTLTVSGKQVTLAVFRQLREEPLIADDGSLNGVPWGTVNYHPDRCADAPEHVHVVWQRGVDLLRSSIQPPIFGAFTGSDYGTGFVLSHLRDLMLDRASPWWDGEIPTFQHSTEGGREVWTTGIDPIFGVKVEIKVWAAPLARDAAYAIMNQRNLGTAEKGTMRPYQGVSHSHYRTGTEARQLVEEQVTDVLERMRLVFGPATDDADLTRRMYEQLHGDVVQESARRGRHKAQHLALADLPQLFIAV
jgi:hypothetical protein